MLKTLSLDDIERIAEKNLTTWFLNIRGKLYPTSKDVEGVMELAQPVRRWRSTIWRGCSTASQNKYQSTLVLWGVEEYEFSLVKIYEVLALIQFIVFGTAMASRCFTQTSFLISYFEVEIDVWVAKILILLQCHKLTFTLKILTKVNSCSNPFMLAMLELIDVSTSILVWKGNLCNGVYVVLGWEIFSS